MNPLLIGIDIGTSACKLVVFSSDGKVVAEQTEPYLTYYPKPNWSEQDPNDWWNAVSKGLKKLTQSNRFNAKDVGGIGVDGQSWSAVAVDKNADVLCPTPIWMDTRSTAEAEWLKNNFGEDYLYSISGNPVSPSYSLPKVLWCKNNYPDMFKRIHRILQSNSFIAYRLTGVYSQDFSQGYGYSFFNMKNNKFDPTLVKDMGLNLDMFPDPVESHCVIGTVTASAAKNTGLVEGIPVVAGGLDAACGALGAGVLSNGQTQEQGGQAGGMSICTEKYLPDKNLILSRHVAPNRWLLQGGTVGGAGTLKWFAKELGTAEQITAKSKNTDVYRELDEIASKISIGSNGLTFLPYMAGERSPLWNPNAKGVFYGLDFSKTRAHLVRSLLEGVAFSLQHNLEVAYNAGAQVKRLLAVGGAANSLLWTQMKADITGKPVSVPSSDTATPLGAAMLAGVGVGVYKNLEEAVSRTVRITRTHNPNLSNHLEYKKYFKKYLNLSNTLQPLMTEDKNQESLENC